MRVRIDITALHHNPQLLPGLKQGARRPDLYFYGDNFSVF